MSSNHLTRIIVVTMAAVALTGPVRANQQPFPDSHVVDGLADGPTSVVTADFDRDGDLDIAATVRWDDAVSWWENPSWTEHAVTTGFTQAHHLVVADLNRDGWPDLVAGNRGTASANLCWYENPGAAGGAWTTHDVSGSGLIDGVLGLAVGDVDGDGYLDIAIAGFKTGFSDGIVMYFQNSGGTIFYAHDVDLALPTAHSVAIGDVDGNGYIDLVAASYGDNKVVWYDKQGPHPGAAWERYDIATGISGAVHVLLVDLDSDRDLDVAACAYNGDEVYWFENSGDASSWDEHSLGAVDGPYDLDAVDLDRDGDIDLVGAGRVDGTLRWWERSAPGSFIRRTAADGLPGARSTSPADLDGDGDLDVVVAADTSDTVAWFENGATRRTARMLLDSTPCSLLFVDITDIEIADVDADGRLDLVAAVDDSNDLLVGRMTDAGFSCTTHDILPGAAKTLVFAEGTSRFVAAGDDGSIAYGSCRHSEAHGVTVSANVVNTGDLLPGVSDAVPVNLDGDFDLDIVAVSPDENRVAWWRCDPVGYSYHWIANIAGVVSIRAADIDRDSDQDLAVITTGGSIYWLENDDGDGLSWTTHVLGLLAGGVAMRIGDFNSDGWPDLMAAGDGVDEIRWWENLGAGGSILWTPRTAALIDNPGTLELADLDRDGALDAVVTRPDAGILAWIRNLDGQGLSWSSLMLGSGWADVVDVAVGDILADGYPDLLVAEPLWGTLAALSNRGGQFAISAVALAPEYLEPNQQVPIFLVSPGHLGRSSDLALELRSLNFSVDNGVTKLTSPQLRSVFSSLSVYYDANQNFVFDPYTDWLLEEDTLPFVDAGGALRLELPHSDFNPLITRTQSPAFFVVGTTTADPAASIEGVRLLHRCEGWLQLHYEDFDSMRARPEYFNSTSSGLMATSNPLIFSDGFESGDLTQWSASVP